uniref:Phytochrome sensor 2 n=1 Tax=Cyanophora paradoxa TaxID=2762 RepID=V9PWX6_CYAPA|nr:phytochrome sensor 2 [Cyanophora paradoxa]
MPIFIPKQFAEVKPARRRENHSEVERRRRDLINERIEELRRIVPETTGSQANKATVLGKAIDHLNILADENAKLQKDKETLMNELEKLRVMSIGDAGPSESAAAKRKRRLVEDGRPDGFIDAVTAQRVNYEPIATIGAVQHHGILLAIRDADWTIAQVSSNVEALVAIPPDQLVSQHISSLFDEESVRVIQSAVGDEGEIRVASPVLVSTIRRDNGERVIWDGLFHRASSCVVLELEPFSRDITLVFSDSGRIRAALENLENAASVDELCQILAHEVSDITGFDRVMVYRFGAEGHGKVLAEVLKKEGIEPYLGLNFPATDIPTVARNLFVLNRVRVIADAFAKPCEVTPAVSPVTERPLDMSKSVLRAVSRCHTQYLKNMGVAASISNAIVKDKKLWGLFICYSYSPKRLSFEHREACILLSRVLSALLARKEQQDLRQHIARAKEIQAQFLDQLLLDGRFPEGLCTGRPNVFDILDCGGAAVYTRAAGLATFGRTPSPIDLRDLIEWLNSNMTDDVWCTDCLSEHFEGAAFVRDVASGLLAVSLSHFPGDYALWFRPEVIQEENWGGPLKDAIVRGENGSLNPRASFQKYVQLVKGKAVAFSQRDITCARALRMTVLDVASIGLAPAMHAVDGMAGTLGGRDGALRRLHEKLEHAGSELLGMFQQEVDGLVETMPLPLLATDRDYRITDWNLMASKLTAYPRAEMIGASFLSRALDPTQAGHVRDLFDRLLADAQGGHGHPGTPARPFSSLSATSSSASTFASTPAHHVGSEIHTIIRTRGGGMQCTLYAAPRRDADGNAIGVIAILHPETNMAHAPASVGPEVIAARAYSQSVLFELVKKWLPCFNAVHIATSSQTAPGTPLAASSVASSPPQHMMQG